MTEFLEADRDDAEAMRFTWFREKTAARSGLRLVMSRDEVVHALAEAGPHHGAKGELPLICAATFKGEAVRLDLHHARLARVEKHRAKRRNDSDHDLTIGRDCRAKLVLGKVLRSAGPEGASRERIKLR